MTALTMALGMLGMRGAQAHCDTLAGPVVADARKALGDGRVTLVMKWVRPADEAVVKLAFDDALALKGLGDRAQAVGERHFLETLVRLHRAGEGQPYSGLKAATEVEPIVGLSDAALAKGSVDDLVKEVTTAVEAGIRQRFAAARERLPHADHTVAAGREYVASYVAWTHYIEGLHQAAGGSHAAGGGHAAAASHVAGSHAAVGSEGHE